MDAKQMLSMGWKTRSSSHKTQYWRVSLILDRKDATDSVATAEPAQNHDFKSCSGLNFPNSKQLSPDPVQYGCRLRYGNDDAHVQTDQTQTYDEFSFRFWASL